MCIEGIDEIRRAIMLGSLVLAPKKSPMGEEQEEDWVDCKDSVASEDEDEDEDEDEVDAGTDTDSEGAEGRGGEEESILFPKYEDLVTSKEQQKSLVRAAGLWLPSTLTASQDITPQAAALLVRAEPTEKNLVRGGGSGGGRGGEKGEQDWE
eukprot:767427-Hanusia_phi.AAC.5